MTEPLIKYLEAKSGLSVSEEESSLIASKFSVKKLLRKQYLLQEGDICKQMAFVVKGAARMFSIDEKGHEHILRFGVEGWWLGDYESYMLQVPTKFHIEMLEESELLVSSKDNFQALVDTVPAVAEMIKVIDKQNFIVTQKRIHAAISLTAEERFENLMEVYPSFLQRFSQSMIASYLGITPETLSRVRKNAVKR
ncbi:MAG: Crp/Fnr family transcriptional regulator [Mucilaginibacter sp.]|nr:Crp/Fnr family transcriptional regulator [Mucilaginibacter sp.]